jgi:hypothetical protein
MQPLAAAVCTSRLGTNEGTCNACWKATVLLLALNTDSNRQARPAYCQRCKAPHLTAAWNYVSLSCLTASGACQLLLPQPLHLDQCLRQQHHTAALPCTLHKCTLDTPGAYLSGWPGLVNNGWFPAPVDWELAIILILAPATAAPSRTNQLRRSKAHVALLAADDSPSYTFASAVNWPARLVQQAPCRTAQSCTTRLMCMALLPGEAAAATSCSRAPSSKPLHFQACPTPSQNINPKQETRNSIVSDLGGGLWPG